MDYTDLPENSRALNRYLSPLDVWGMAFGVMVGWGVFVMPGTTFLPVAGPMGTVISLVIGTAVMLLIGVSVAYLMVRSPQTGGIYSYTKEAFGRDHAFLCAWFLCLSYLTVIFLNGSALFLVMRTVFGSSVQSGYYYMVAGNAIYLREIISTVLVLTAVGVLFVVAKPILQRLQTVLALVLAVGLFVIAVACLPHAFSGGALRDYGTEGVSRGFGIFSLVLLAPWAFVGFEVASFDTAHFQFPVKKSRTILLLAILVAGLAYLCMALVAVSVVPDGYAGWGDYLRDLENLSGPDAVPTFYAARAVMGGAGLAVAGVTALAAILTGIIGAYRAMIRLLSTMAEDNILSERFSRTNFSIVFILLLSTLISLLGRNTLSWFTDLTSFGAIAAYGYTCAAAWRLAKAENRSAIRWIGLAGALISLVFAVVQLIPNLAALDAMGAEAFLMLSLWCLLGFVFYWRTVERSTLVEYSGMSTSGTVLFALLVYAALMWLAKSIAGKGSIEEARRTLYRGGLLLILIFFVGLVVMLYIQNLVRRKHEAAEREKIRAVESSLAKSQFLFNMSHDIRTPMNAIIGYTSLARQEGDMDTVQDYLKKIDTSGRHLLSLLNDILEMSRIESGKVELEFAPMDLREVFEETRDLFSEQMRQKNLDFSVHDSQVQHPWVWCDRKNLQRVLLNVLSNAWKFTPEGGAVSATLWEIGGLEDGYASYEIRIRDNGIGMSKEFAEKMFTAFERERSSTDSGMEGTGLGMSITKSIVDRMGGAIEVLTSPGSGTEIIIRLKMQLAEAEEVAEAKAPRGAEGGAEPVDFQGKRLLLVDDNRINMEIANMILEQQGFVVDTAENGQIALEKVSASGEEPYDAILMDIQMPVMDGYEATRAIRALENTALARIPIVAMTANAFQEDVEAAEQAGMQGHVPKPVDLAVLTQTLQKVLSSRS